MGRRGILALLGAGVALAAPKIQVWTVIIKVWSGDYESRAVQARDAEDAMRVCARELPDPQNTTIICAILGASEVVFDQHFASEYLK